MRATRTIAATAALAAGLTGCFGDDGNDDRGRGPDARRLPDVQLASSLRRFGSCDELRAWARDELAPRVGGVYGFPGASFGGGAADLAVTTRLDAGAAGELATAPQSSIASFSETNTQVEGVDEPDIVKTDATRVLAITNGRLFLVDAASQRVLDSVELPGGMYDGRMLLAGDRVLVFGSDAFDAIPVEDGSASRLPLPWGVPGTRVVQYDIAGEELQESDAVVLDGSFVSARMVGDVVRLVVHADPGRRLAFVTPAAPTEEAIERATATNRSVVDDAQAEDFLPRWRRVGADGEVRGEGALLACEDAHAPDTFAGFGMVTVLSIDVSGGLAAGVEHRTGAGVLAGGQTVYASAEHLYVAAPEWQDWQAMTDPERRAAAERHGTNIHRFDIGDPARAEYEASGRVDGDLLNQFAMDEHEGNLRVATTIGSPWAAEGEGQSHSQVVVLAPGGDRLEPVGKVDGLGRGESIQSVRFLGDVGYVVTFRQTDPLYTIDLSDPSQPRVAGELKILGYSAYLHPVADGKLVGVGQDANEDGRRLGTQVALYDVSDPAAPQRVAHTVLADAGSEAEWDHHAFLWWPDTGLVAIPVNVYGATPFTGLVGLRADTAANTITEAGRIRHAGRVGSAAVTGEVGRDGSSVDSIDPGGAFDVAPVPEERSDDPILRSFVIGDRLWTLSYGSLGVSDLATLGQTSLIPLA